ncbi:esterase/lipase family protein [Streptomyces uncialis]|uniref:esterase/lipase family protein n=1 Tax=Streptomyces uncialis TaxID=1048205 RepID=UPI0036568DD2
MSLLRLPLPEPLTTLRDGLAPRRIAGASTALLKATALEAAVLAGHLLLYPSGITQERHTLRAVAAGTAATPTADPPPNPPTATAIPAPPQSYDDDPPPKPPRPDTAPPVVLLHGFVDNRSVFVLLRRVLGRHGRRVEALNHSPLTCDIRTAAEVLGRYVEELCERSGQPRVDLVGHSLGGLIGRYYVQRLGGDARIRTLVTLGTPHSGTRAVPLMDVHPVVRQMRPESDVIAELALPAPGCRTRFVSFWSDLDQVMAPLETACLDHPDLRARNIAVTGIGHLALPVHPAVTAGIRAALDGDDQEERARRAEEHEGADRAAAPAAADSPGGASGPGVTEITPASGNRDGGLTVA